MATLHDGDPYTSALVAAFADAFTGLGGAVPAQAAIAKGDTDMTDVLTEFAAAGPDAIFFPLFVTEGSAFAAQARAFAGLEGTTLISAAALLVSAFLEHPQSEGIYFQIRAARLAFGRERHALPTAVNTTVAVVTATAVGVAVGGSFAPRFLIGWRSAALTTAQRELFEGLISPRRLRCRTGR